MKIDDRLFGYSSIVQWRMAYRKHGTESENAFSDSVFLPADTFVKLRENGCLCLD